MKREGVSIDPRELRREIEPLDVLLVDDNEQWARFMADKLQRQEPSLEVTVALSANEAILALRERDSVDCMVTDYRMPEVDGIQLLERVREEWPKLPFVLITGEGSEDVASEAIDAGVTDYLVKDPNVDQTTQFVNKILAAVDQYLLRQAIEESEVRYRTVIEQSQDAIMIVQNQTVVFCNRRLEELVGYGRDTLQQESMLPEILHPDDRPAAEQLLDEWQDGGDLNRLQEVRLVTAEGKIRDCEWAGQPITEDGEQAVLVSIRDVTERKQRERELQWERELNRNLQTALVEARTREQLEQAVTELLVDYGYALAWIGDASGDSVHPWAVAGDRGYVDELTAADRDTLDSEPSVWAARRDTPQFVGDFADLFPTGWRDTATEYDYRSGGALPLTYNNITYGVLAVYHERRGQFDETEQQLLTELADTVAFALHTLETRSALAADHVLDVSLQVQGTTHYLADVLSSASIPRGDVAVTVHGTAPHGDEKLLQYASLDGIDVETFRAVAAEHPAVDGITIIDEDDSRLQIVVTETTPEAELADFGAVVRSTTAIPDQADLAIQLPARETVSAVVETLERAFDSVQVASVVERDSTESDTAENGLTEKQAAALEAAYHHGYFEQPRKNSATEIADALGVTHSTFLQHLRTAQRKVFRDRFD